MQRTRLLFCIKSLQSKAISKNLKNYKNFEFFCSHNTWTNKFVFACEHASNNLPDNYSWSLKDVEKFESTHWAYDIK